MADGGLLRIYLNDHLALATSAQRLARRSAGSNEGTELGRALERLERELDEERRTVEQVVRTLGYRPSRVKQGAVVVGELAGRLKLNGRLTTYSPLSRLLELEGLTALASFNLALWRTLVGIPQAAGRLEGFDLDGRAERAEARRVELAGLRDDAARQAFATG